jgi:hypothetical protein
MALSGPTPRVWRQPVNPGMTRYYNLILARAGGKEDSRTLAGIPGTNQALGPWPAGAGPARRELTAGSG